MMAVGFVPAEVGRSARANMPQLGVFSRSDRLKGDAASSLSFHGSGFGRGKGGGEFDGNAYAACRKGWTVQWALLARLQARGCV